MQDLEDLEVMTFTWEVQSCCADVYDIIQELFYVVIEDKRKRSVFLLFYGVAGTSEIQEVIETLNEKFKHYLSQIPIRQNRSLSKGRMKYKNKDIINLN